MREEIDAWKVAGEVTNLKNFEISIFPPKLL
jgi:hypothetical protein